MKRISVWLTLLSCSIVLMAQIQTLECVVDWDNVDKSSLPVFSTSVDVGVDYAFHDYIVQIAYPLLEPIDTTVFKVDKNSISAWPEIHTHLGIAAKCGQLDIDFVPLLLRDGKCMRITSFDLVIRAEDKEPTSEDEVQDAALADEREENIRHARASAYGFDMRRTDGEERYAVHSLLSTGRWRRVKIASDGLQLLTPKRLAAWGFKDPAKVRVFGYGGHRLPEYGIENLTDDLPLVTLCRTTDGIVFWGKGPTAIEGSGKGAYTHVCNPYALAGSYFITEINDSIDFDDPTVDTAEELLPAIYRTAAYRCRVLEVDAYAFHPSGRKLFDRYDYANGATQSYNLTLDGIREGEKAYITVAFAHDSKVSTSVDVFVGNSKIGTVHISPNASYSTGNVSESTFETTALSASTKLTLTHNRSAGTSGRLDYIRVSYPSSIVDVTATEVTDSEPVENQDLHATTALDYVIVVPSSGIFTKQAERLAEAHRQRDGLTVKVVTAQQIYNEFSSGTPDATAIRRYMKMLYDRASTADERPQYLLLFGDGAWDNRMLSENWKGKKPDDYLLCFESENSFSDTQSFVMEDYFALLDDGEGKDLLRDKPDIGVGRFPVSTVQQARDVVDKTIAYMYNTYAGAWKNTILMLGDDGDDNQHMNDAEYVAKMLEGCYPKYILKRIYWDTYPMEVTATGNSYPAVHKRIMEMLNEGALMVNYSGHGSADVLSHELVIDKGDVESLTSPRLPLWVTASCDISPFDNTAISLGEDALLNPKGGAIAMFSTTRTVFSSYNRRINYLFSRYVFSRDVEGHRLRLGDAVRKAKTELVTTTNTSLQDISENKLHYVLLGDPALTIGNADYEVVVDHLNGQDVSKYNDLRLSAGAIVTVDGHIENQDGIGVVDFDGTIHPTVLDNSETVVGRNNAGAAEDPFSYTEHTKVLFTGSDSVRAGKFMFTFRVPLDINYSDKSGLLNLYAINKDKTIEAQGCSEAFLLGGTEDGLRNDSTGPSISLYLNTSSFVSGDQVNETPLLVAVLEDPDGINTIGNGIGHDLVAIIDGDAALTYKLNNYYSSNFGDYTRGILSYSLPPLSAGKHTLTLRAWDMMNNSSVVNVEFYVIEGLCPALTDVTVTKNPAMDETTFLVTHDRPESVVTYLVEVFDLSGRVLWSNEETMAASTDTYMLQWNVCNEAGTPLTTGVYLYRVTVSSLTGKSVSQSHKLVVKR